MDPELKTLLTALAEGQIKLAEGQAKLGARVDSLAVNVSELTGDVRVLAKAVGQMSDRLDRFGQDVVRGFTDAGQRHHELEERVRKLEQAVFERKGA